MNETARLERPVLAAGLLIPGGGSLMRGRFGEGLAAAWSVSFLVATALVDLVIANLGALPGTLRLAQALAELPSRPHVPPTVPMLFVLALTVHGLAAWGAARRQ